jgi:uncharacterized protein (TIGR02271 family)
MNTKTDDPLPIEGTPVLDHDGWSVRLPVRTEEIIISKQSVVTERVRVQRKRIQDIERVDAVARRERLRTTRSGPVEIDEQVTERAPGT